MASASTFDQEKNPEMREEWLSWIRSEKLAEAETMFTSTRKFNSASQFVAYQFLLLRVLWNTNDAEHIPLSYLFPNEVIKQAKRALEQNKAWGYYLEKQLPHRHDLRQPNSSNSSMFALVRWQQLAINSTDSEAVRCSITPEKSQFERIIHEHERNLARRVYTTRGQSLPNFYESPNSQVRSDHSSDRDYVPSGGSSEGSSSPSERGAKSKRSRIAEQKRSKDNGEEQTEEDAKEEEKVDFKAANDEQTVNAALISLLDSLTLILPGNGMEASSERKRFRYGNYWTAITDGCLRRLNEDDDGVSAIIEVKAALRGNHRQKIQWQEAGEMTAWMFRDEQDAGEHPMLDGSRNYWRVLIAQDRHEIWVVIAQYDNAYKEFIKTGKAVENPRTFMTMMEYGPFDITRGLQMQQFAVFVQAFCLLQTSRRRSQKPQEDLFVGRDERDSYLVRRFQGLDVQGSSRTSESSTSGSESQGSPSRGRELGHGKTRK